ncbi:tRNA (adenosine(37)-N6)-threonylcarbamoyltransferase complex ATPase subunit type 1 TsaE [soil metagenome]
MPRTLGIVTTSPEETRILGAALAPLLLPGDVISLSGDLGAGKTVFVQGVAAALGVEGRVTSPSFTIVHHLEGRYRIVHIDVYRLESFQEVLDLGFEELLDPEAIMLVEWGEAVAPLLPRRHLEIELRQSADGAYEGERVLIFRPRGEEWQRKLEGMCSTAETLLAAAAPEDSDAPRFFEGAQRGSRRVGREHPNPEA